MILGPDLLSNINIFPLLLVFTNRYKSYCIIKYIEILYIQSPSIRIELQTHLL